MPKTTNTAVLTCQGISVSGNLRIITQFVNYSGMGKY